MEQVKDIISGKDLSYISDMFNWNYNALKEVNHFLNEVESDEIKEILEEVFNMHYENCTKCISILENEHEEEFMETDSEEYEDDSDEDEDESENESEEDSDENDDEEENEEDNTDEDE